MSEPFSVNLPSFPSLYSEASKLLTVKEWPKDFHFQGHRGARGLRPENTIPSFLRSLELGIHTLELDVVISQDKQVVVSHEPWFNPDICSFPDGTPVIPSNAHKHLIYQMPYEEVKKFDCGKRGNPKFKQQIPQPAYKPLLKEVIEAADDYAKQHQQPLPTFNIEIKTENEAAGDGLYQPPPTEFVKLVQDIIELTGTEKRVIVQSFDIRILKVYKKLYPNITLSYLLINPTTVTSKLKLLGFTPSIYTPNYMLVTEALIEQVHNRGMKIFVWTVNEKTVMVKYINMGVDGIITDYPNLAAELLNLRL